MKSSFRWSAIALIATIFLSHSGSAQSLGPNFGANFTRSNAAYEINALFNHHNNGPSTVTILDASQDPYSLYDDYMIQDGLSSGCAASPAGVSYCPTQVIPLWELIVFAMRSASIYRGIALTTPPFKYLPPDVTAAAGPSLGSLYETAIEYGIVAQNLVTTANLNNPVSSSAALAMLNKAFTTNGCPSGWTNVQLLNVSFGIPGQSNAGFCQLNAPLAANETSNIIYESFNPDGSPILSSVYGYAIQQVDVSYLNTYCADQDNVYYFPTQALMNQYMNSTAFNIAIQKAPQNVGNGDVNVVASLAFMGQSGSSWQVNIDFRQCPINQ